MGDTAGVEAHLDHQVPVNLQLADTGESLLMAAASSGSLKLVEMLFRKGAKADLEDMRGRNALHYGCKYPTIGSTVAMRGADLTLADSATGATALHLCAAEGHVSERSGLCWGLHVLGTACVGDCICWDCICWDCICWDCIC